jgi:hypothetical protein
MSNDVLVQMFRLERGFFDSLISKLHSNGSEAECTLC